MSQTSPEQTTTEPAAATAAGRPAPARSRVIVAAVVATALCGVLTLGLKVDSYLMAVYPASHPNQQTNLLVERGTLHSGHS